MEILLPKVKTFKPCICFSLMRTLILLSSSLLFFLCSCNTKNIHLRAKDTSAYCPPSESFDFTSKEDLTSEAFILKDSTLLSKYSVKDLLLANAAGVYKLLRMADSIKRVNPNNADNIALIDLRQDITIRLLRFSAQVQGVVAELDCEGERAQQMATFLDGIESKNIRRLTIASIVAGAIAGIITSVSENPSVEKTFGVGGGVASAGLGIVSLFTIRKIRYYHKRNLLEDIWKQNETSSNYPTSVLYILNEKEFSNAEKNSISHNIRERWVNFGYVGNSKEAELYFGTGGKYNIDQLKTRANMLNQLQSSVRQIHQDLEILLSRVARNF